MSAQTPFRVGRMNVVATVMMSLFLTGCFLSKGLFERERIWDPVWFGRYESPGGMFVVLPDDPAKRTYLIGSFESGSSSVDSYRAALYTGWDDVLIVGTISLGKNEARAAYTLLRPREQNRFVSDWPSCDADFAARHNLPREGDTCTLPSLDTARRTLRAHEEEQAAARAQGQGNADQQSVEHRRDHPLSTIGIVAKPNAINDSDGVHGALMLLDVLPESPAAHAGLKRGDVIVAVANVRPAIGEELLLRIAAARAGGEIRVSVIDGKTKEKREVSIKTAPLG